MSRRRFRNSFGTAAPSGIDTCLWWRRPRLLVAKGGAWNGTQILPKGWTDELVKPCPVAPFYGLMWWLNTDRRQFAAASDKSYFALGWGSHIVWIDPDNDLVTVLRWIDRKQAPGFVERLLGAINK